MLILVGFFAGLVHVWSGPDHLAAIAPYAVQAKRGAWRTGVRWGLGHATGVFLAALGVLLLRSAFPIELVSGWGERLVGFVLVGIGAWGLRTALVRKRPPAGETHAHGQKAFAVGTLHGTAGSAHLLGVLPALALPSNLAATAYLLLFGAASVAAMGSFASLVGWFAARPGANAPRVQAWLLCLSSLLAIAVGGYWLSGPA